MKFLVQNKKYRFEYSGTMKDLVEDLEGDEIPCEVKCVMTNARFKISKKKIITTDKQGNTKVFSNDERVISANY